MKVINKLHTLIELLSRPVDSTNSQITKSRTRMFLDSLKFFITTISPFPVVLHMMKYSFESNHPPKKKISKKGSRKKIKSSYLRSKEAFGYNPNLSGESGPGSPIPGGTSLCLPLNSHLSTTSFQRLPFLSSSSDQGLERRNVASRSE